MVRTGVCVGPDRFTVIDDALVHKAASSPRIDIAVTAADGTVVVAVRDTNPPIHDREITAVGDDAIDPLHHGLWFVSLVVRRSGDWLAFDANEPRGNVVRIAVDT